MDSAIKLRDLKGVAVFRQQLTLFRSCSLVLLWASSRVDMFPSGN